MAKAQGKVADLGGGLRPAVELTGRQ